MAKTKLKIGDIVKCIADKHHIFNTNVIRAEVVGISTKTGEELLECKILAVKDKDKEVKIPKSIRFLAEMFDVEKAFENKTYGDFIDYVVEKVGASDVEIVGREVEIPDVDDYITIYRDGDKLCVYDNVSGYKDSVEYNHTKLTPQTLELIRSCHVSRAKVNCKLFVTNATGEYFKTGDIIVVENGFAIHEGTEYNNKPYRTVEEAVSRLGECGYTVIKVNE